MPRGRPNKAVAEAKQLKEAMNEHQIESIQNLDKALQQVMSSFRGLENPHYNHIVDLDNAFIEFHYLLREIIHND
jgi:demethoxyubiquinone hydroxylase (CLK1/Coq7/Cat5 family)